MDGARPCGVGGLSTRPLILAGGESLTVGLRAGVTGNIRSDTSAGVTLTAADGAAREYQVPWAREGIDVVEQLELKAVVNGLCTLSAKLDPEASVTRTMGPTAPHNSSCWLSCGPDDSDHERIVHWLEGGALPLAWKWGTDLPGEWREDRVCNSPPAPSAVRRTGSLSPVSS